MYARHPPSAQLFTVDLLPGGVQAAAPTLPTLRYAETDGRLGRPTGPTRSQLSTMHARVLAMFMLCYFQRRSTFEGGGEYSFDFEPPWAGPGTHNVEQCLSVGPEQTRTWLHC